MSAAVPAVSPHSSAKRVSGSGSAASKSSGNRRRPMVATIRRSCQTPLGASVAARTRETVRSMFIVVPSDSPHVAAGRTTSARAVVSVWKASWATRNVSSRRSRAEPASGSPATGLVATVQTASTSPPTASTTPTGPGPASSGSRSTGTPHSSATIARSSGSWKGRWPGQVPFDEQTRAPIELAWPVSEKGPLPGRRLPVARQRSTSARAVSVPWTCWLTPIPQ